MNRTFDNGAFMEFTELYKRSFIVNKRYGLMIGADDLANFVSMTKKYKRHTQNLDWYHRKDGSVKHIYRLIEEGEESLTNKKLQQAIALIRKAKYLNMWARKNARPFILRKIEPDEDPIALADELLETLYIPALCL